MPHPREHIIPVVTKCCDCLEWMREQPDDSVALVVGSPPYAEKGERYGDNRKLPTDQWVRWMLEVTTEAVRVSSGPVLWVVNGAVRDGHYLPGPEGLVWEWHKAGGWCERSLIWHKNAPPNRRDWWGNDWEPVVAFKKAESQYPFNWEQIGHAPKYAAGGRFRQRSQNGRRRLGNPYPKGKVARPRDVLRFTVGGGHLGSPLAHLTEAPYPEALVAHLIMALTNPGDCVLDCFAGSGTTLAAALKLGRSAIGLDIRQSQVELMKRRLLEVDPSYAE
jgi:DNA modification methylase